MKTRVTITLDSAVHAQAKRVARARRTTVSGMIEAYLRRPDPESGDLLVDRMIGSAELKPIVRGRDPIHDALYARYIERDGSTKDVKRRVPRKARGR
jgi:hypothetical protein